MSFRLLTAVCVLLALVYAVRAPAPFRRSEAMMGTLASIQLPGGAGQAEQRAVEAALEAMREVERRMSDWDERSELSGLNRQAGKGWVRLSAETLDVLDAALGYARASGGAFDPTCGQLVRLWGFRATQPPAHAPTSEELRRAQGGWKRLRLDKVGGRAGLTEESTSIDLGAIAKGYAVDRAVAVLRAAGARCFQVDLGGNLFVGDPPAGRAAWRIGIKDPNDPLRPFATVLLANEAIATSGGYERFVTIDGRRYGHILDPRTGQPARSGVLSATVVAPTAMAADALSTIVFVLGFDAARTLLDRDRADAIVIEEKNSKLRAGPQLRDRVELNHFPG